MTFRAGPINALRGLACSLPLLCAVWLQPVQATESVDMLPGAKPEEESRAEWTLETGLYYTDIGYNIPLTKKPIPTISSTSEVEIYRELIKGSLIPRFMTLEASIYPVPYAATYIKSHTPGLYRNGRIGDTGINVIESAAAGFQEPYAVSAFFGNVAKLRRPGDARIGNNIGYTGYLVSYGNRHIKDTLLIPDNWYEVEWKIKGKMEYPDEKLSWSLRIGAKNHSNPNIVDVMYLSLFRSNMGFNLPFLSFIDNADVDIKLYFTQRSGQIVREEYIAGKKYPISWLGAAPTLDFGLVWNSPGEYTGALRTRHTSAWTLLFRPSLEF